MKYHDEDIICYCEEVSYKDIKNAIYNGATTVEAITEQTNAGLACGTCIEDIEFILEEINNNGAIERKR